MTSKEINKKIKALTEEKEDLLQKEKKASVFHCSVGEDEDKIRPVYDFEKTQSRICEIDKEIRDLKHKLNVFNSTTYIGDGKRTTIDKALIEIPQLSQRKATLKEMANRLERERVNQSYGNTIVDYEVVNYDIKEVEKQYRDVSERLDELQKMLDKANSNINVD